MRSIRQGPNKRPKRNAQELELWKTSFPPTKAMPRFGTRRNQRGLATRNDMNHLVSSTSFVLKLTKVIKNLLRIRSQPCLL